MPGRSPWWAPGSTCPCWSSSSGADHGPPSAVRAARDRGGARGRRRWPAGTRSARTPPRGSASSRSSCRSANRDDADDPGNAELVAGAGLVYLSGGSPATSPRRCAAPGSGRRSCEAWRTGAALAGCSAGAMALSAGVPGFRRPWRSSPGLGLVPVVRVVPHFDRFGRACRTSRCAGSRARTTAALLVGIDEETALVGGPRAAGWQADPAGPGNAWQVLGRQSAWLLGRGRPAQGGRRRERRPAGARGRLTGHEDAGRAGLAHAPREVLTIPA